MTANKKPHLRILPLLVAALAAPCFAASDWSAIAQVDMKFAIDKVRGSHAGSVSGQIDVTAPLEAGARTGMLEAADAKTEQDYKRALVRFINGFGDPHTGIQLDLTTKAWTGVVLDHVDGRFRVVWSEPNWPQTLPPRGAVVQSCDNVWIGTYLKSSVAPFSNHSLEYDTTLSDLARKSMFDVGLGWTPKQCVFQHADGSARQYDLPLRAVDDGIGKERLDAVRKDYQAKARPVGLYRLAADKQWVGMPDFNGGTSGDAYTKLYPQLSALKKDGWIVFDLRGNGGGDSSWGNRALQALYGEAYGEQLGNTASYVKSVIADQATIDLYRRYASLEQFAASKPEFERVVTILEAALSRREGLARVEHTSKEDAAALAAKVRRRPGGPRVAAVIDRGCFSSCMNFVQQISSMSDTVLLGEATIGYSPYGENGQYKLPSGHGAIIVPSAIYTAFQATREPFVPALRYDGNMADDDKLMKWVDATLTRLQPGKSN
ncbi:S41 family peptidase [Duganella sp. CF517]|uniref:S41 family peptidase n=1 Tax=Duganella sp. CF517 TaxID=1881038 RepID=UPI0015A6D1B5|nr:S41 family peptidase [Duganella sp. CF517]